MKILITNIVALNGGDAAIMYGMINSLRDTFGRNIDIHIYASNPDICQRLYPEFKFRETLGLIANKGPLSRVRFIGRILRSIQRYRYLLVSKMYGKGVHSFKYLLPKESRVSLDDYATADVVISSGGTYLIEAYGLVTQCTDYSICNNLNQQIFFYTQSLGPFTQSWSKEWMRSVFSSSSCILVRDEQSYANIKELNIDPTPKVIRIADAAFSLANRNDLYRAKERRLPRKMKIAFSVREWGIFRYRTKENGIRAYRESIATLVKYFVEEGHEVSFFSTCQGVKEYTDDSKEAGEIMKLLPVHIVQQIAIQQEYVHFKKIMEQLKEVDFLIGTRLHMSILSLIVGTPVLPIAYEFKTKELFLNLGFERYVVSIENISPELLLDKYAHFISDIDYKREELFSQVELLSHNARFASNYIKMPGL